MATLRVVRYKQTAQVLRAQLELGQVRQEIDRRLAEKEEEFENTRSVQILLKPTLTYFLSARTTLEQWTPCRQASSPSSAPRPRR